MPTRYFELYLMVVQKGLRPRGKESARGREGVGREERVEGVGREEERGGGAIKLLVIRIESYLTGGVENLGLTRDD